MPVYGVEVYLSPVPDSDPKLLEKVLDLVPGTLLLDDPTEPVLIFTLLMLTSAAALQHARQVSAATGYEIVDARLIREPEEDFAYHFKTGVLTASALPEEWYKNGIRGLRGLDRSKINRMPIGWWRASRVRYWPTILYGRFTR